MLTKASSKAKVINAVFAYRNEQLDLLIPGDLITLSKKYYELPNGNIGYHVEGPSILTVLIDSKHIELIDMDDMGWIKKGLRVKVSQTLCKSYGKVGVVHTCQHDTATANIKYDNGGHEIMLVFNLTIESKDTCTCNFYHREAYGCSCGRILE